MMTREEVAKAAVADPSGFGFGLVPTQLLSFADLTDEVRELISPSWTSLAEASDEDDFYNKLMILWRQGCEEDSFAPKHLEKYLRYAGFTANLDGRFGIAYVLSFPGDDESIFHLSGFPPVESSLLRESPDYGPVTRFSSRVHGSLSGTSGDFLQHPSWTLKDPFSGEYTGAQPWSKFYAETMDDMEESMTFSEGPVDKTDDTTFRPNPETTVLFSNSNTYHFVEPGDPTKFWRFWSSHGDMELQDGNDLGEAVNPVDECLLYILGAE